jgi:hypothetical protein
MISAYAQVIDKSDYNTDCRHYNLIIQDGIQFEIFLSLHTATTLFVRIFRRDRTIPITFLDETELFSANHIEKLQNINKCQSIIIEFEEELDETDEIISILPTIESRKLILYSILDRLPENIKKL